jgi:hypothetical protein
VGGNIFGSLQNVNGVNGT